MMELIAQLKKDAVAVVNKLYNQQFDATIIKIDKTHPEFTVELTLVIFPFVKISKKNQ